MGEHNTVYERYNELVNDAEHLLDKCERRNADQRLVKIEALLGQIEIMEKLLNGQLTDKKICFEINFNPLNQKKVSGITIKKENLEKAKQVRRVGRPKKVKTEKLQETVDQIYEAFCPKHNISREKYDSLISCLGCGETFPCYAPMKEKRKYYHQSFYIHCGTCPDYIKLGLYRSCDKCQVTYLNNHAFASHMKACRDKFGSATSNQDEKRSIKKVKNIPPKSNNDDFI
ncbi:hypothetical protein HDE_03437 [Halotydeus destructor]|nr:hypothetical protein HDE_03437 [Halotydeus destructor]